MKFCADFLISNYMQPGNPSDDKSLISNPRIKEYYWQNITWFLQMTGRIETLKD